MILVNSVPNLKSVAPKLQKLSHRKVSINVAHRTTTMNKRHQSGKTYSLVEIKFRRDKNSMISKQLLLKLFRSYFILFPKVRSDQEVEEQILQLLQWFCKAIATYYEAIAIEQRYYAVPMYCVVIYHSHT